MWRVYAGDVDLEGDGVIHTISQFLFHPDYDWFNPYVHNIVLIEVSFIIK
jgi:hypothetical protein